MNSPLDWPRRIPRNTRVPLTGGHGSFCLHRVHSGDDAFDRQGVRLIGYLLVLVREGSVIIDGGAHSLLLQAGDAALVPPGRFEITEIPHPPFSHGATALYFFNQQALADLVAGKEGMDEVAARITLPALPFYPIQRLGAALDGRLAAGSLEAPGDLRVVFTAVIHTRPAMAYTFLKHAYFVPHFRLCVFLECRCHGRADAEAMAARYPHGARAFRRDCADYFGTPVEHWIFRRKIEIAQAWLRYSKMTAQEAGARLGFDDLCTFRGHLKRFGGFSPLELEVLRRFGPRSTLAETAIPFWYPSSDARVEKHRRDAADHLCLWMTTPKKHDMRALLKKYPGERCQPIPAMEQGFLIKNPSAEIAAESLIERQAERADKIITLERVETWQVGGVSLGLEPALTAVAA